MRTCDRACSSPTLRTALLATSCVAGIGAAVANYFVNGKTQDLASRIGEYCINKMCSPSLINTTCATLETTLATYNRTSYGLLLAAPTVTVLVAGCAFMISRKEQQRELVAVGQEVQPLLEEN